ncbi:MAG: glycosyltransferase family 2 protein [Bdellovibrionales bacterium]|nr:glycosyltransferase family 2 protein [Bdellovibrionales bacterium]
MSPSVSVIIPTYNRGEWTLRAVDSVLGQTFQDFEIWLVDDGSDERHRNILRPLADHSQIHYQETKNRGVSAARNLAITQSQSPLIALLDSDDVWVEDKLQRQVEFLENHPQIPLVHGEEIWWRNGKRVNPMKKHQKSGGDVFADSLKLCCISPSATLMRRELLDEVGLFREDFPACEDYDLWLRITQKYLVGFLQDPVVHKYGGHEDQLSRKYKAMDYWRVIAMNDLYHKAHLQAEQKDLLLKELKQKTSILLQGYRKHQNLKTYDAVFKIWSSIQN